MLNFGIPGVPTTRERDTLHQYKTVVDPDRPPGYLEQYLLWSRQTEEAARGIGFVAYNHEHEVPRELPSESLWVNSGSGHPSARLHRVYGEKLYRKVIEAIDVGEPFRSPR